jgi:hypothetical protein
MMFFDTVAVAVQHRCGAHRLVELDARAAATRPARRGWVESAPCARGGLPEHLGRRCQGVPLGGTARHGHGGAQRLAMSVGGTRIELG